MNTQKRNNKELSALHYMDKMVVFIYADWSPTEAYLSHLKEVLQSHSKVKLFTLDIDQQEYKMFSDKFKIKSHGKGEVFFMNQGLIKNRVVDYKKEKDKIQDYLHQLI